MLLQIRLRWIRLWHRNWCMRRLIHKRTHALCLFKWDVFVQIKPFRRFVVAMAQCANSRKIVAKIMHYLIYGFEIETTNLRKNLTHTKRSLWKEVTLEATQWLQTCLHMRGVIDLLMWRIGWMRSCCCCLFKHFVYLFIFNDGLCNLNLRAYTVW